MLSSQAEFKLLGNFLLRLECFSPWAVVALNLVVLPTGLLEKGEGQTNQNKQFFSDSVIASTNLLSVPLGTLNSVQRKAVLFLFVLKINLLLNFFKYLLLWVEGRNFFLLNFALGIKHFCALCSPKGRV